MTEDPKKMKSLSKGSTPLVKLPKELECQTKVANDHWTVPSVQQGQRTAFKTTERKIQMHCFAYLSSAFTWCRRGIMNEGSIYDIPPLDEPFQYVPINKGHSITVLKEEKNG